MLRKTDNRGTTFSNASAAMMALQEVQMYFALAGFLTTSTISIETGRLELTVHFDLPNYPTLPNYFNYSRREVHSHQYWSDTLNELVDVRTIDFYFVF